MQISAAGIPRRLAAWAVIESATAVIALGVAVSWQHSYKSDIDRVSRSGVLVSAVVTDQRPCAVSRCVPSSTLQVPLPGGVRTVHVATASLPTRPSAGRLVTDARYDASHPDWIVERDASGRTIVASGFPGRGLGAQVLAALGGLLLIFAVVAMWDRRRTRATTRRADWHPATVVSARPTWFWANPPWLPAPHRLLWQRRKLVLALPDGSNVVAHHLGSRRDRDLVADLPVLFTHRMRAVAVATATGHLIGPAGWQVRE